MIVTQTRQKHALYTLEVEVKHYSFFKWASFDPSDPVLPRSMRTGKLRVRVYPRVGSGQVEIFGAGRVRVRVSKSATGTVG